MKTLFSGTAIKTILLASLVAAIATASPIRIHGQPTPAKQSASQSAEATTPGANSTEANDAEIDENKQYRESPTVRKIGGMIGLTSAQSAMAFEMINFIILLALVGFGLVKALPKLFRDRNSAIQKDLVDARTATEQASIRLSGVESRLSKLDDEIAALRAQAEKASALDEQRIAASVEEEKQKILAAAEQEIAAATITARRQLQQYAAELAIEQAARKLVISAETDRLLVQNFARRLGSPFGDDDSKDGQN